MEPTSPAPGMGSEESPIVMSSSLMLRTVWVCVSRFQYWWIGLEYVEGGGNNDEGGWAEEGG